MKIAAAIAPAGACGALCRWGISRLAVHWLGEVFPYGTLIANIAGCLLIGFLMHIAIATNLLNPVLRSALTIGFLGALTTFSTFSYETMQYFEESAYLTGLLNIALNIVLCLAGVFVGMIFARTFLGGTS